MWYVWSGEELVEKYINADTKPSQMTFLNTMGSI